MQTIQDNVCAPSLDTLIITGTLPYLAYIDGADAESEPYVELTQALVLYFDNRFPAELLAQQLRVLDPVVLLVEAEELDGILRSDCPVLSDEDLDRLQVLVTNHLVSNLPGLVHEVVAGTAE